MNPCTGRFLFGDDAMPPLDDQRFHDELRSRLDSGQSRDEIVRWVAMHGPRLTHTVPELPAGSIMCVLTPSTHLPRRVDLDPELSALPVSGPEPINGTETFTLSPLQIDTLTESADVE